MTGYGFQSFPKNIFNSFNWEMIKSFLIKQKKYARYSFSTPSKKKQFKKQQEQQDCVTEINNAQVCK